MLLTGQWFFIGGWQDGRWSYTGNGADNRSIPGVGFQPAYLIIRPAGDASQKDAVHKSASTGASTDMTMDFRASGNDTNEIQALEADGFQVGSDVQTNQNGKAFYWIAFAGLPMPPPLVITAPEAYNQFDPASKDVLVFGRAAGSGVPPGPVAPQSVVAVKWGDGKADDDDDKDEKAELRTYRIVDLAGNSLTLVEKVKKSGHEIKVKVVSLQYNNGPVITPPENKKKFEWSTEKDGSLKELEQEMEVGKGKDKQEVEAKYEAKKNQTTIKVDEPKPEKKIVRPGLALLRLATNKGTLNIEY